MLERLVQLTVLQTYDRVYSDYGTLYTGKTRSIYVSGRDPCLYRIYTLRLYPFEAGIILKSPCSLK